MNKNKDLMWEPSEEEKEMMEEQKSKDEADFYNSQSFLKDLDDQIMEDQNRDWY